jgi:hypothetical protein
MEDSGKEKQTDDSHVSSLMKTVRSRSYESLVDDFPDPTTSKSQAKKGVHNSRFMENQVVYYTSNNGLKEKTKILKIHLDDHLVPFYDIRIEDSGKEKQTDDAHLSSLTDDLWKSISNLF